jgi:hypothetical protein
MFGVRNKPFLSIAGRYLNGGTLILLHPSKNSLRYQMRRHKPDKLSRTMPKIASDRVIGTGTIGTFLEPILIGIARHHRTIG